MFVPWPGRPRFQGFSFSVQLPSGKRTRRAPQREQVLRLPKTWVFFPQAGQVMGGRRMAR